jgi:2-C-methyl-D-erythritol 4-phosphate cytidylyltransferase
MPNFCVILAAAGKSSRFNNAHFKKPFAILAGKAVWLHSAELFLKRSDVKQLILVLASEDRVEFTEKFGANVAIHGIDIVIGGAERSDSVQNALGKVRPEIDFVAIHDAARPCIDDTLVGDVFSAGVEHGIAVPTVAVRSTLKRSADGKFVEQTVDRSNLYLSQTPQVFSRSLLEQMFADRGELQPTDEAQLAEEQGHAVAMVAGSRLNIKITTQDDLDLAAIFLKAKPATKFDAPLHPFKDDNLWR